MKNQNQNAEKTIKGKTSSLPTFWKVWKFRVARLFEVRHEKDDTYHGIASQILRFIGRRGTNVDLGMYALLPNSDEQ